MKANPRKFILRILQSAIMFLIIANSTLVGAEPPDQHTPNAKLASAQSTSSKPTNTKPTTPKPESSQSVNSESTSTQSRTIQGVFYSTGKTVKYYDLLTNTTKIIYSSATNTFDGLYYDAAKKQLWFTEKSSTKKSAYEAMVTYSLKSFNLATSTCTTILKEQYSSVENPDYLLHPAYIYNNLLLMQVDASESSYLKLYDMTAKKTIMTIGENTYSAAFPKGGEVYIISCDDENTVKGTYRLSLNGAAKLEKISESTFKTLANGSAQYYDFDRIVGLPELVSLPRDTWGNFYTNVLKNGNYLALLTYAGGKTGEVNGNIGYLPDTLTLYDLNTKKIVKNISIDDLVTGYTIQPFSLKY